MDVSFTNVLEGARQYFQGLPVPSTGGGAATSVDLHATSSTNSASSTSTTTHNQDASQPTQSNSTSVNSSNGSSVQESNRYPIDVRPSLSVESSNAASGSSFWNPHVEPYPPQPTKVEVSDTRPGDESSAMEPSSSSSGTVTLTEMQPSNHQSSSSSSAVASIVGSSTNFSQTSPPASSSSSSSTPSSSDHNHHHQLHTSTSNVSSHLHQMQPPQPPHSPGPVYQQLNSVSRSSFNTAEMLASSSSHSVSTYQTASNNDRPSQPIVVQRAQYYPRYHHPDITKCAPAPYSQSSIYQSANVAQPSSTVQQPSTRPTPMEQNNASPSGIVAQGHCPPEQQRVPGTYGSNVPSVQNPLGGSTVYGSGSSSSSSSSQNYRSASQYQQQAHRLATASASSLNDRSHSSDGPHSSTVPFSSSSTVSPRQPAAINSSSSYIPSQSQSQNLPGHIPSPSAASSVHHQQQQQQQSSPLQQQHPSRINVSPHSHGSSYGSRVLPLPTHGVSTSTSSAAAANHSQQHMPPPSSGYHAGTTPSPHHEMPSHHATPPSHHATPSPHHATPSPQRQSPHVSNLHNPHASPSPHHTPSPHNSFQPHSPTYPPPPPPVSSRSTPHSYNLPSATSQHYQTNYVAAARDTAMALPYAPPPSSQSSYHSFQKSSQSESQGSSNYYSQSGRSHSQSYGMQQMLVPPQTVFSGTPSTNNMSSYQQSSSKHATYNGAEMTKRSAIDVATPYATHRSSAQRNSNTHNLPPIAALSSYHSNRREFLEKSAQSMVQRQRIHSTNVNSKVAPAAIPPTTPSSMAMPAQRLTEYPMTPASVMNHALPVNGRTTTVTNMTRYSNQQGYLSSSYATTLAPSHHGSNSTSSTTVTSISHDGIGSVRSSVSTIHAYQSSDESDRATGSSSHHHHQHHQHHHHHQPPTRITTENYGYKEYPPYQNPSSGQTVPAAAMASSPSPSNAVRKRESPLDLSVKTVKTSADSTAQDDLEATSTDKHVSSSSLSTTRSNMNRPMPPPPPVVHQSTPAQPSYPSSYDSRPSSNSSRNPMPVTCVRASTPQTVCAPKVDFLPDFNSAPLRHQSHHENPLRRSTTQLYVPPAQPLSSHHANNTASLPHMSTFKKRPLPTSLYDGLTIPPPSSSSSASSASYLQTNDSMSSRFSKYSPMMDPSSRVGPPTLPTQDYTPNPNKYYLGDNKAKYDQQFSQRERMPFKRAGEAIYGIGSPSKQPRVSWRVPSTDKQIAEPKLSTANALNEQQKRQEMNLPVPLPNGTLVTPGVYDQRPDSGGYPAPESSRYQPAYCDKKTYPESKIVRSSPSSYNHQVISKPNANVHVLPQQLSGAQPIYSSYRQAAQKTTCSLSVTSGQPIDQPSNTGADKRVLSLLRNSLENKQQRDEQLNSQQPILVNHSQQSFQNKVVAPVEPKTNIGRHNLSPFTAASLLERNSNTPPHYKLHVPRAVDSITQEAPRSMYASRVNASATLPGKEASLVGPRGAENQIHRDKDDGLAAILAAKIRTKAELKQVGTGQFTTKAPQDMSSTPKEIDNAASTSTPPQSGSSAGSPPKLTREKTVCLPPRRRLFSRTDDDNMPVAATVPAVVTIASTVPTRASGCRSSSETSVFDFRESDSEGEMPVLERQTLEEMRRDRKQLSKVQPPIPLNDAVCMNMASSTDLVKIELKENDKINDMDPFWSTACDKFIEQLRAGDVAKKRGRRKKLGGTTTSKLEDATNDSDKESDTNAPQSCKSEDIKESLETNKEDKNSILKDIKIKTEPGLKDDDKHSNDDSDEVPLIKRKKQEVKKEDSDCDEEVICQRRRIRRGSRIKLESSSGSESSSEDTDASTEFHGSSVADRLRARKRSTANVSEGMKLRSRDATPHKVKTEKESKLSTPPKGGTSQKAKPKPLFGDGSDFRPGWEEEVYVYKKSLRMPPRLITVSKPSRFHRLSTSLPDLDPGSPALSVSMDSSDVCLSRNKRLIIDSDMESNYSFSITGLGSKIDDEEATSSTTVSCPPKAMKHFRSENNSIVDVLAQKVGSGGSQKDLKKKQNSKGSKVFNKNSNEPELLPTPSLTPLVSSETSKNSKNKILMKNNKNPIKVANSVLLGYFRKETVNNFRDAFKNNHTLPNEFSTIVLKSRTRTETKILKKEATIREVFGEDRPASAPPMQNHDDTSQDDDSQNETPEAVLGKVRTLKQKVVSRLRNAGILRSHKAIANSKRRLLTAERRKDLLKSLANKKLHRIKTEIEQEETNDVREEENNDEDDKNDLEIRNKKKLKLRPGRRKFSSGFDYIRKKKKPLKRDEALPKERKRQSQANKPSPECVTDIQSEIRTWVIKKGVGETILHRAARLGYTDVTAYCLEKLNSAPSPKDNAGYTPLHEACSKGHLEIAKLLLAYGANVSESANGGIRPLHEAAENGVTELVRLLLSYGADPLLATYSGQTPLMLAVDTEANSILEQHLDDIQGRVTVPWSFAGPASIFDPEETGYNPLDDVPSDNLESVELNDVEMEVSDINLPVLFTLNNDPDKWVLLQDLMAILRIKSRDALLRQINPKAHSGPPAIAHRDVMRELKLPDFLEQTRCCHLLSGGERINVRGSKVTLIKYNDKVKSLLNVEKVLINLR